MNRAVRLAVVLALGYGAVQVLVWGTAAPLTAVRDDRATFEDLVIVAAGAGAGAALGWVALVLACTALTAAPGVLGGAARRLAGIIASAGTRRLAHAALGLAVTAGPAAACTPATAEVLASGQGPVAIADLPGVGRPGQPIPPPIAGEAPADEAPDVLGGAPRATVELTPTPGPTPVPSTSTSTSNILAEPTREPEPTEVVVKRGDSLWALAAAHLGPQATDAEIAVEWPRWYDANRSVIGPDPDLIRPGTVLVPPDPAGR